jgi:subtilisin family serine protease
MAMVAALLLLAACAAPTRGYRYGTWSYVRTILQPFWWYEIVDVAGARAKAGTGAGASVAIVDTGVLKSHEDLALISPGEATCGKPTDTDDVNGHGTQLAGIAVGQDPGHATRGVAPGASLIPIKIDCGAVSADALTKGIDAAIARKPDVILLALGGYPATAPDVPTFMLSRVTNNPRILFVVASVWDGSTQYPFPAWTQVDNALVVAAMTLDADKTDDRKADKKKEIPYSARHGHIWAPGRNVGTADILEEEKPAPKPAPGPSKYHAQFLMPGTSPAAAMVAGCAALVKSKTGYAGAALRRALVSGAEPQVGLGDTDNRRLNCAKALP